MLMDGIFHAKILNERDKSVNECRLKKINVFFALMSLRLALIIVYFLVMNSKRCKYIFTVVRSCLSLL